MHKGKDMRCERCKLKGDTQSHVLLCCMGTGYLRDNKDLRKDEDMITYFRQVLKRRMKE